MGAGVRAAALIFAGLWVAACDGPPHAEAARTPFESAPSSARHALQTEPTLCQAPDSLGIRISFLDVGQGDAALITGPDRRRVLVDAGPGSHDVFRMLRSKGIDSLDLIVASHNHLDHIGGFPEILQQLHVANAMENGIPATTAMYRRFVLSLQSSGALVLEASARTITLGDVKLRVLPPAPTARSQNDASVGLIISYGEFRLVLTGDAEVRALGRWLRDDAIPAVKVVKASHHGSHNGVTPEWVTAMRPALVVLSLAAGNSYGHPHEQTLAMWRRSNAMLMRTDRDGIVEIRGCLNGHVHVQSSLTGERFSR